MRYVITSTQLNYFRKEGQIALEGLFKEEEAYLLNALLEEEQTHRPSGRDLQRENPPLKKAMQFSRLGQIASHLFRKKRIQVAFTQFPPQSSIIASVLDISSVTEILGGALIRLSTDPLPPLPYLPANIGDAVIYDKNFQIDFTSLSQPLLLIAFTTEKGRYRLCPNDPHTHELKKIGYGFGDLLSNETHPLIIK